MPCVCANTTLRLFIRNVTQLDLPVTAKLSTSRTFSRRQAPALSFSHARRQYSDAPSPQYQDFDDSIEPVPTRGALRRAAKDGTAEKSLQGYLSYINEEGALVDISLKATQLDQAPRSKPTTESSADNAGIKDQLNYMNKEGAIVEFSPDAIDAIASEAASEKAAFERVKNKIIALKQSHESDIYDTPWRSLQKDMPRRRERVPKNEQQGLTIKRGWTKTEGLKIHYSAAPDWQKVQAHGERLRVKREKESAQKAAAEAEKAAAEKANDGWVPPPKEPWMVAKERSKEKYPDGWNPLKRLSPDAMAGIRALHAQMPEQYTTWVLAEEFKVSPEAMERILRTKWRPSAEEQTDREQRWQRRGERVWSRLADLGHKPPAAWREMGIGAGKPDWMKSRETPRPRTPLPALITTARRRDLQKKPARPNQESLADQII